MLVLTLSRGDQVTLSHQGREIARITLTKIETTRAKLGIDAPLSVVVNRAQPATTPPKAAPRATPQTTRYIRRGGVS